MQNEIFDSIFDHKDFARFACGQPEIFSGGNEDLNPIEFVFYEDSTDVPILCTKEGWVEIIERYKAEKLSKGWLIQYGKIIPNY